MRKLKITLFFIIIATLAVSFYAFSPRIIPYIPFLKNKIKEIRSSTQDLIPEAKISAPLEQSEFEKTASYGEIDCRNVESNVFVEDMLRRINSDRIANGKKALKWNEKICESARLKAEDMNANNYFEHNSPSGITPWYWIKKAGYKYTFVGENLALNYFTSQSAHEGLMNSPGHRANILNDNFTEIGINYVRGKFDGEDAFFVVQHFASPAPEKPQIQYICEINKANKQLSDLKDDKNKIEKYLKDAEKIRDKIADDGGDTTEVDNYIDDMEDKEEQVNKYIKEVKDYLKKCEG